MEESLSTEVKIRDYQWADMPRLQKIFAGQGLPENCFPELVMIHKNKLVLNPRFIVKKLVEDDSGQVAMAGFVKVTSEAYLLLDHSIKDPVWRWEALKRLTDSMADEARRKGIDCVTAWVPNNLVDKFGARLETLGFQRSPWVSFSRLL